MEDLKQLIEDGKANEVLSLTEGKEDSYNLIYRLYALSLLERGKEVEDLISKHQKLLEKEQLRTLIEVHLDYLIVSKRFDDASKALEHYLSLNYESQEVEELMQTFHKEIERERVRSNQKNVDPTPNEVISALRSEDSNKIASVIPFLLKEEINIAYYMNAIQDLLINAPKQELRSTLLILLNDRHYDKEVSFNHLGTIIKIIPNDIDKIDVEDFFKKIEDKLQPLSNKDRSVVMIGTSLIGQHLLNNYPLNIDLDDDAFFLNIVSIARKMLNIEPDKQSPYNEEEKNILDVIYGEK